MGKFNLYQFLTSDSPASNKLSEIDKFNANSTDLERQDIESSMKLALNWIVDPENDNHGLGIKVLIFICCSDAGVFATILGAELNTIDCSKNLAWLLETLLKEPSLCQCTENVLAMNLVKLTRKFGYDLAWLVSLTVVCKSHPDTVPKGDNLVLFCVEIVCNVASLSVPTNNKEKPKFVAGVTQVATFVQHLWLKSQVDAITPSLSVVYTLIACNENGNAPCPALAAFLQITPVDLVSPAVVKLLEQPGLSRDEHITRVTSVLCDWLTAWPVATHLPVWVLSLLQNLVRSGRSAPVADVSIQKAPKLLSLAVIPIVRSKVLPVVKYMLLTFQHSPVLFHKVLDSMKRLMECLKREISPPSVTLRSELAHITISLMEHFPGYDELYVPLRDSVSDLVRPSEDYLRQLLKTFQPLFSVSHEEDDCACISPESLLENRSPTGKVGLINLGNTCFMNCVLQALFMNADFCSSLLEAEPTAHQSVLVKLQYVFAFLLASYRSVYSPAAFLKAARPPWFEPGRQQDCSEFLRYLLDTLHEQERLDRSLPGSTYERITIRPSQEPANQSSESEIPQAAAEPSVKPDQVSLIHRVLGGRITTRYRCLDCGTTSIHRDTFTDISLAFPSSSTTDETSLDDMLSYYLAQEKLEGDNRYRCDSCATLQDAERSLVITQAPETLLLSLMRFRYDKQLHQRGKIMSRVNFPEVLYLPAEGSKVRYLLCAVVVHSGISLDGGHYYTFARSSNVRGTDPEIESSDPWYLYNDSQVSSTTFSAVTSLQKRFAIDTPYLLWYRRCSSHPPRVVVKLRPDLRNAVEQDNEKFIRERRKSTSVRHGGPKNNEGDDDSDSTSKPPNEPWVARFVF